MAKNSKTKKKNWIRRFILGGIGVLGAFSPYSDAISSNSTPSVSMQMWISDSRRKDGREGYSISELTKRPTSPIQYAAHRSHRSHASHYSSQSGHKSHYSHYSSYNSSQGPVRSPQKVTPSKENTPARKSEPKGNANNTSKSQKEAIVVNEKQSGKLISSSKVGVVKTVVSPTTMILQDSTIIKLAGVKNQELADKSIEHSVAVKTRVLVEKMIKGETVRFSILPNKKAYIFMFPNELECLCLNLELIKEGKLVVDDESEIFGLTVLLKAEKEAKKNGIGVWEKDDKK